MQKTHKREPGIRIAQSDIYLIILACLCSIMLTFCPHLQIIRFIPIYLIVVFLGFCNVFRIGTTLEFMWILTTLPILIHDIVHHKSTDSAFKYMFGYMLIISSLSICLGWYRGWGWSLFAKFCEIPPESIANCNTRWDRFRDIPQRGLSFILSKMASQKHKPEE